jgi:hypothetical protein
MIILFAEVPLVGSGMFLPSKETHFGLFYNDFPPSVCKRLHTVRLLSSRCASRGNGGSQSLSSVAISLLSVSS